MTQLSPKVMEAITNQYAQTICELSARCANLAASLAQLGEQNAALAAQVEEMQTKMDGRKK